MSHGHPGHLTPIRRAVTSIFLGDAATLNGLGSTAFALAGHLHDDRYYTEAEIDAIVATLAPSGHNHDADYVNITGDSMSGALGVPQLNADNLRLDGNTLSSTNTDGDITLAPNGAGSVVITSDLTVQGTTTTISSNEVNIGDNIIVLNSDETGTPTQDAGIEIERGTSTNARLVFQESDDTWYVDPGTGVLEEIVTGAGGTAPNADLLDSLDSAQFLRSDVADTVNGQLTFSPGTNPLFNTDTFFQAAVRTLYFNTDASSRSTLGFVRGSLGATTPLLWVLNIEADDDLNWDALTTGVMRIDGNRILTTADEGSGNGLDADTLDGLDSTDYLRSNTSDSFTGGQLTLGASTLLRLDNQTDLSLASTTHPFQIGLTTGVNLAIDGNEIMARNNGAASSLFLNQEGGTVLVNNNRVLTVADEGTGNGLDADTVDGLQASQFLRSDATDTATGQITFNAAPLFATSAYVQMVGHALRFNTDASNRSAMEFYRDSLGGTANFLWQAIVEADDDLNFSPITGGNFLVNNNRVLTTADEGSGNGIDADTVDGLDSTQFLRSDADDTTSGTLNLTGAGKVLAFGNRTDPLIHFWSNTFTAGIQNSTLYFRTAETFSIHADGVHSDTENDPGAGGTNMLRLKQAGSIFEVFGNKVWHQGNDGAGSGLDADTLDGVEGSGYLTTGGKAADSELLDGLDSTQFLRSDADDTVNGILSWNTEARFGTGGSQIDPKITFNGDENTGIYSNVVDTLSFTTGGLRKLFLDSSGVTIDDDLVVEGGDITLLGTGRIQGIDTVSANTDAASKSYVDAQVVAGGGAKGGGLDRVFWENDQVVTTDYTITDGQNAMSAGPITINDGITVTVGDGEYWTVVGD